MESRIKQLRENRGLIQEILASELGITQQMLSKYERDVLCAVYGIQRSPFCFRTAVFRSQRPPIC